MKSYEDNLGEVLDEFCDAFRDAGIRLTNQRIILLDWVIHQEQGFTMQQAIDAVQPHGIGQATVYRAIAVLEELGLLRKMKDPRRGHLFIPSRPGHHHSIICDSCGRVEEFDTCGWQLLKELLCLQTGFDVHDHYLEVRGICALCKNKS